MTCVPKDRLSLVENTFDAPSELRRDFHGSVIANEDNVRILLAHDPIPSGLLQYNAYSRRTIVLRPVPLTGLPRQAGPFPRDMTDEDIIAIQAYLQRRWMPRVGRAVVAGAVQLHASTATCFHPLRDYLDALAWDGNRRVRTWLAVYMGCGDPQPDLYLNEVGSSFLVSAVARIYEPGCQADSAPVFEGRQGAGKTSALRLLAGSEYFSDCLPQDLSHKDAMHHLPGKWLIELPECSQFKRSQIESIKAFLSRRVEVYRPAYGRVEIRWPRQCVFAGTTNESQYLVDTTGNRRFWPVKCGYIDLAALERDRDQLWAEAVHLYRTGHEWHLTGEAAEIAADEAWKRVNEDPWLPMVDDVVNRGRLAQNADIAPNEVLKEIDLPLDQQHARSAARVGTLLKELGWPPGPRHRVRGQLYLRPAREA